VSTFVRALHPQKSTTSSQIRFCLKWVFLLSKLSVSFHEYLALYWSLPTPIHGKIRRMSPQIYLFDFWQLCLLIPKRLCNSCHPGPRREWKGRVRQAFPEPLQSRASVFVLRCCGSEPYLSKPSRPPFKFDTLKFGCLWSAIPASTLSFKQGVPHPSKHNSHKYHGMVPHPTKLCVWDVSYERNSHIHNTNTTKSSETFKTL